MKLIIGKHSDVVNMVRHQLLDVDIVSHNEIGVVDATKYSQIIVFSWSHVSHAAVFQMLKHLPAQRVLFVSTLAVISGQLRSQWAVYPRLKSAYENLILKEGGRILRIGSVRKEIVDRAHGAIAYTPPMMIAQFINEIKSNKQLPEITELFNISIGGKTGRLARVVEKLNTLSRQLPQSKYVQMPLALFIKTLGFVNYSYTADSNYFLRDHIQIGYGAVGGFFAASRPDAADFFIVSGARDVVQSKSGFSLFKEGFGQTGLGAYWHGVRTEPSSSTFAGKHFLTSSHTLTSVQRHVPPPHSSSICHVFSIAYDGTKWRITGVSAQGAAVTFFCRRLTLACGPLENIRLLSCLDKLDLSLSDDENAFVGQVFSEELVKMGLIGKFGPFQYKKNGIWFSNEFINALIEFRPLVKGKINSPDGISFYLEPTKSIFKKLLFDFSLSRINEAFFNKFGLSVRVKTFSVFVQALAVDAIRVRCANGHFEKLERKRLPATAWAEVQKFLEVNFAGFVRSSSIYSIDGLHVVGGEEGLNNDVVKPLIASGVLNIVGGAPHAPRADPFHTTRRLRREISA